MEKALPNKKKTIQRKISSRSGYFYKYETWSQIKNGVWVQCNFRRGSHIALKRVRVWYRKIGQRIQPILMKRQHNTTTNDMISALNFIIRFLYSQQSSETKKKTTIKRLELKCSREVTRTKYICIDYNRSGGLCECVKICHFYNVHNSLAYLYWIAFDHWSY